MKIGYRTLKTAIGTPIAIYLAQWVGLSNFISAGILTILCIQPSRKSSFLSAWQRFIACTAAVAFSCIIFEFIGYHAFSIFLLLLLFIPATVALKATPGIASSSVVMLNLYGSGSITLSLIGEQFVLIIIGIGIGLLLNVYMPSLDNKLKKLQSQLEENFSRILYEYSLYIRDENDKWQGREITAAEDILMEAKKLVIRDKDNHLLRNEHTYYNYFKMRERQFELLKKMLPHVTHLPKTDHIALEIADFFERLSQAVHPGNTAITFLDQLTELKREFHAQDLPETREAFETRAYLFQLLHEIEAYLIIKNKFKKSDITSWKKEKIKRKKDR
ncbi:aromatic acid exporter family protein [Oceanobacillus sp. CFH 90083]|uniref:aromatic acid exporter family protein n=1 Tax=Oceanobacillus sp. CFH 90083 TaxID=2592336 RepID=UPI00128B63B2|nr:aromatic acid exporter family protein [Oceanobacillus sp. CFH 90083]